MTGYVPWYGDYSIVVPGKRLAPHVMHGQKCCVCGGRPCLRAVGNKGFCAAHTAEAFKAAAKSKGQMA